MKPPPPDATIFPIERPHPDLLKYYLLSCLIIPPLFPFLALPAYFRYHTMRYRFTAEGVSMSWGVLFRREIIINYARIQDIHLRSNVVERWLGLARVLVQTASGNASAEMTLEGLKEFESVRDFLYHKMRGVKDPHPTADATPAPSAHAPAADGDLAAALREVAAELRALRAELPAARSNSEDRRHV